jgi:exopolysaccharide biosynthesis polyprenyl glycosylphosphotransferase
VRTFEINGVRPEVVWRRGQPLVELRAVALRGQQLVLKRLLDLAGASLLLVLLWPTLLAIALAVRLDSRGPAVFGQRRLGRHGRLFRCFKFRSMHADAEQRLRDDPALHAEYLRNDFKLPEDRDPRITRVGRFLRKTSLDELPQLWNVLRGDMSLVGPRPPLPCEVELYEEHHYTRFDMKPGMTGPWQVSGRNRITDFDEVLQLECSYLRQWSIWKDIEILVRTIPEVLKMKGAH